MAGPKGTKSGPLLFPQTPPLWLVASAVLLVLGLVGFFPSQDHQEFQPLKEVRWGIIGCGDVTEKKSGPALSLIEGSRLVMVMRRNASLAEDYARRHNVSRWTDSAAELINDPEVNAVYIATPPRYHVSYALMAAKAGKPVYVEKPMGVSAEDGVKAVQAFRKAGLPLYVAYYRRALPNFLHVKHLIDSGAIGALRAVTIVNHRPPSKFDRAWVQPSEDGSSLGRRGLEPQEQSPYQQPGASLTDPRLKWRVDPFVGGAGGHFRDLGSHQLDLLNFWMGPLASISGSATNQENLYPTPDTFSAQFKFKSGVLGSGSWCFVVGKAAAEEYGEILGTKGKVRFHFFTSTEVEVWNETGHVISELQNPAHVQQPLLQTVVDALRGRGECSSTGATALEASAMLDVIVRNRKWP